MISSALVFASFSLSALVGQLSGSLVVSDTTHATVSPAAELGPLVDDARDEDIWFIENLPMAELRLSWPESLLMFGYGPRIVLRDPFVDADTLVVHVVRAAYLYTSRPSRIGLELTGNFGRESLTLPALLPPDTPAPVREPPPPLPGAEPVAPATPALEPLQLQNPVAALSAALTYAYTTPRLELVLQQSVGVSDQSLAGLALAAPLDAAGAPSSTPSVGTTAAELVQVGRVRTFSETTSAGLQNQLTRRLRSQLQLSYGISGGLRDRDEAQVPQIRTASGSAGLTHLLSRRDDLTSTVVLTQSEVSPRALVTTGELVPGTNHWILGLTEAWIRRWTPTVSSTLSAGVTGSSSGTDGVDEREESVNPNLAASLFATLYNRRQTTLSAALGATLAPQINGLTGQLQTQLGTFAGLGLTVEETSVNAEATMGQTLPADDAGAARVITAGAGVTQRVLEFLTIGAQYRSIWQDVAGDTGDDLPRLWTATFTLALVGPGIDF